MLMERINQCKLMDIVIVGPKFTWRGPLYHRGQLTYEKLDRLLSNDSWNMNFFYAYVKVVSRFEFSDHHLILITLMKIYNTLSPRAFQFQSAWMTDEL